MKKLIYLACFGLLILSCKTEIKNPDAKVIIEEGTQSDPSDAVSDTKPVEQVKLNESPKNQQDKQHLGFWVGYFEKDSKSGDYEKSVYIDEAFVWNRENKINISIDRITDSTVVGHSVVAGNDRPFIGKVVRKEDGSISFVAQEPGDDKYDGEFKFTISNNQLSGTWQAFRDIDIKYRKYTLEKRQFAYNPDIMLEPSREYINWNKRIDKKEVYDMGNDEFEEWVTSEFATATALIYSINASNTNLKKTQVANLKKGDLTIIRNTIYARHGYSFKNRPLRVFFDSQEWYIPVHSDIKKEFTELEKTNIKLLLQFEKNAAEYYDYFGRG